MTNEEAIEVLTNHRRFIFEDSEEDIAIVMAISALKNNYNSAKINHISETTAEVEITSENNESYFKKAVLDTICSYGTELERNKVYQITVCDMKQALCNLIEELPTIPQTDLLEDIKRDIEKLPRIKVGNSNSPTVKYCIDERLLYEIVEKMKGEAEREKAEQTYDWCKGCKEYDTEKHCCHRYSSFIRESLRENINAVLEDIKAEFIKRYPLNYCGEPELGGVSCVFSLNEVLKIIDNYISRKEK